ncbi:MAG: hypothetical protein NZ781_12840, partial [Armatimonadetes bacterium]|nr:hypothetical protein [Armatimonadota bacterium]
IPPSKDGVQRFRQRLWAKAHSMVLKKHAFVIHATGFSQWLMRKQMSAEFIRRKYSSPYKDGAKKFRQRLWLKLVARL